MTATTAEMRWEKNKQEKSTRLGTLIQVRADSQTDRLTVGDFMQIDRAPANFNAHTGQAAC